MELLQKLAAAVLAKYERLDLAVQAFAASTGLRCPEGCGHCCRSEKVEATVLECLPAAFSLFANGRAESVLDHLHAHPHEKCCVLYRPYWTAVGRWGCSLYQERVIVCRLFGFAGNVGRDGQPHLALCRVMKEAMPEGVRPLHFDKAESPMPLFSEAGLSITTLHPGLGTTRLPINEALCIALQKVGMVLTYQQ